jgi:hypothetical protein
MRLQEEGEGRCNLRLTTNEGGRSLLLLVVVRVGNGMVVVIRVGFALFLQMSFSVFGQMVRAEEPPPTGLALESFLSRVGAAVA